MSDAELAKGIVIECAGCNVRFSTPGRKFRQPAPIIEDDPTPVSRAKPAVLGSAIGCTVLIAMCAGILALPKGEHRAAPADAAPLPNEKAEPVQAWALSNEYRGNEVAADQNYKGRLVEVTGFVHTVGKGIFGERYVVLTSGQEFDVFGVQCFFSSEHDDELADLAPMNNVTIRGRCEGFLVNVMVKHCELVHPRPRGR